ncbi:Hypothetical predicted protein [Mytilus galloprovincialis]|uniref:Uncharacterized protein n=1 Tax=Mytilus galloprovincialis TaxID=29158 RepID=A0A8B6C165_MYTGA|nr:Hypothetical predicted protein [Mytilus galloprovincialis]
MFRPPKTGQPLDQAGYVGDLEEALRSANEIAMANHKISQLRAKQAYDLRVVAHQYKVGDVISKLDTASLPGKCKKLNPMWRGPGVILKRISPYLYKVKMKKALTTVNHDRLKLCRDRELPAWVNRAIVELQNGGRGERVAQAMQPNNLVTPSQDSVKYPVGVDQVPSTLQSTEGSREDRCPVTTVVLEAARRGVGLPRRRKSRERSRSGSREGIVRDPSGGRSRCSVSRSTPGAAVPMARDTPLGIPVDRDAHSAPPLGRGFQGRKETTQERKRRKNRQKECRKEETARLQRALRDAQQRRTPQSGARGRAGVSAQNSFQGGGRRETGVLWQRTPQRDYTSTGTGVSGQRTPQNNNSQRENGVSGHRKPQGGCQERGTGVSSQETPQRDYRLRETGVSGQRTPQGATSQRRLQQDYVLRETGVSGQRAPQFDTPRESDLPTLQRCPIQGCPIKALYIQPHVMLEHVAEVFGEPTGSARASLAPIRVAALQAQAWMLVGGDLEDSVTHINRLTITRPHIIGQSRARRSVSGSSPLLLYSTGQLSWSSH